MNIDNTNTSLLHYFPGSLISRSSDIYLYFHSVVTRKKNSEDIVLQGLRCTHQFLLRSNTALSVLWTKTDIWIYDEFHAGL